MFRLADRGHHERLRLLPPEALVRTGRVDHADWNYRPILGRIQRTRFRLAATMLPHDPVPRLLELGYGSGVFLFELAGHCRELHGVDLHPEGVRVMRVLAQHGVDARLVRASVAGLPYRDGSFDAIVAVSAMEFVLDLPGACREIARVLRPSGLFVVVTPGHSAVVDAGLRVLTGERASRDFGRRRDAIVPTLRRHFACSRRLAFPGVGGEAFKLYEALQLTKLPRSL